MPTVEHILDIFDAVSRKDWNDIKSIAESVSEYERKKKHFNAAAKIKEAAELVIANNTATDLFTMSGSTPTAPPMELLERSEKTSKAPILPQWLSQEVKYLTREWRSLELLK